MTSAPLVVTPAGYVVSRGGQSQGRPSKYAVIRSAQSIGHPSKYAVVRSAQCIGFPALHPKVKIISSVRYIFDFEPCAWGSTFLPRTA